MSTADGDYDDDYGTCLGTHATLCLYSVKFPAAAATAALGLEPTKALERGWQASPQSRPLGHSAWFLETDGSVKSRDLRRHLDWLLDQLSGREIALRSLQQMGWTMDVSAYWLSRSGHGGPMLWPRQLQQLGQLNLEVWFDIYFTELDDRPLAPGELTRDFRRAASHWRRFGIGKSKN